MKRAIALILLLTAVFSLLGCDENALNTDGTSTSLVIIAGKHANANTFSDDMLDVARTLIKESISEYHDEDGYHAEADVSIIVCDGDPKKVPMVIDGRNILKTTEKNTRLFKENKKKMIDAIIDFLSSDDLKADDPEVDLLKAVSQAQDILNSRKDTEHHILILDTGITTSGYLNMRKSDIITTEKSDMLEIIREGVPDLNGTKITFLGLGNVAGTQSELSSKTAKDKLLDLWTSIFESAGAELTDDLYVSEIFGTPMEYDEEKAADGTGYPMVSTVFFVQPDDAISSMPISIIPITEPEPKLEETPQPKIAVKFHTSDLGFEPNEATFKDINQAYNAINLISPDIERLINETNYRIYVVGSIAKKTPDRTDKHNKTSHDRAHAVANILISEYRVPSERLVIIDAGVTEFSWRNADESDSPKQENRVVAVISENTIDLINELISAGYIDSNGNKIE